MGRVVSIAVLAVVLAACLPEIEVRVRTRVLPDGTTLRETAYHKIRHDAQDEAQRRFNERPIRADLGRGLGAGFPSITGDEDDLVLSGAFPRPDAVPPDFRRDVAGLAEPSENRIEFETEDLLFGTRYLYRERFLDAIRPDDQGAARRALVRFAADFVRSAVRHEFGEAYDVSGLQTWIDGELTATFDALLVLHAGLRRDLGRRDPFTGATGLDRLLERGLARIERLGLRLDPAARAEAHLAALQEWTTALLARTLAPRQPGPAPVAADFRHLFPADDPLAGLRLMAARTAEREFGSVAAAETAFRRALLGDTGTYGAPPAEAVFHFDCALQMPGVLLRTNGWIDGDGSAFWLFEGSDLFPDGYLLEAESVVLDSPLLGRIRELRPRLDRRDAVRLVAALREVTAAERREMGELLEACARHGTLAALPELFPEREELVRRLHTVLESVWRQPGE